MSELKRRFLVGYMRAATMVNEGWFDSWFQYAKEFEKDGMYMAVFALPKLKHFDRPDPDAVSIVEQALQTAYGNPDLHLPKISIEPGLTFKSKNFKMTAKVHSVDRDKNSLSVILIDGLDERVEDHWNLQHTEWGFESGEYYEVVLTPQDAARDILKEFVKIDGNPYRYDKAWMHSVAKMAEQWIKDNP